MASTVGLYVNPENLYVGIGTTAPSAVLDLVGNINVSGSLSAMNMGMYRNRILNGDMRIDQRGGGGTAGAGVGSSSAGMTTTYSLDRWAIALGPASGTLCAAQTTLNATDQAALGGAFTNAAVITLTPVAGLNAYYPFESNVNDASGNGYNLTTTGSMAYVPGRIGSNAVYLANETNVVATPSRASNRLTLTYSVINPISFSFWMLITKCPLSGQLSAVLSFGTTTTEYFTIQYSYSSTTASTISIFCGGSSTPTSTVNINTWYHIAGIWSPSTSASLYVNGTLIGTTTTSIAGYLTNETLLIGDNIRLIYNRPFAGFIDDFRIYNRVLSASEIAALAGIAPIQVAPDTTLASGLTTRLTFDNTTADAQGTLGTPTATGTTVYSSLSKSGTRSLDLTGNTAGGTMTVGQTYTLLSGSFALPMSMGGWINDISPTTALYQVPWCIGNNTGGVTYTLQTYFDNGGSGKIYNTVAINSITYSQISPYALAANTWYHIFLVVNNSYLQFYINGVLIVSTPTGSGSLTVPGGSGTPTQLRIGAQTGTSLYSAFKGYVDDVRIYNRALSPQEVAGLYYSYQPSPYVLYQQPIEGFNVADLGWGTTAAQSATVSAWIKNNTASAQQFSLSAGNAGAAAATSVITFESGIEDTLGFLTNPVGTNVVYSTSVNKVGTRSLDLTANTASSGVSVTTNVSYVCSITSPPITLSAWVYVSSPTAGNYQVLCCFGNASANNFSYQFVIGVAGQLGIDCWIGATNYSINFASATAISQNTWTHICTSVSYNETVKLYINGNLVGSSSSIVPFNSVFSCYNSSSTPINAFRIGSQYSSSINAYKGYIDDVRIYNKALTATEVYQLYAKNATSTTISQFLLPRSYLYTTPSIPANTWQKISFTIPGDTTDAAWAKDNTCGLNLALCLGAGGVYISSGTSGWASAEYVTGSNVQIFGGSATNFLADAGNSIYITGVQLERGTLMTPFEFRPFAVELQLCQRYYEKSYDYLTIPGTSTNNGIYYSQMPAAGNMYLVVKYKNNMRIIPTIITYDAIGNINKITNSGANNQTPVINHIGENSVIIGDNGSVVNIRFHFVVIAEI